MSTELFYLLSFPRKNRSSNIVDYSICCFLPKGTHISEHRHLDQASMNHTFTLIEPEKRVRFVSGHFACFHCIARICTYIYIHIEIIIFSVLVAHCLQNKTSGWAIHFSIYKYIYGIVLGRTAAAAWELWRLRGREIFYLFKTPVKHGKNDALELVYIYFFIFLVLNNSIC